MADNEDAELIVLCERFVAIEPTMWFRHPDTGTLDTDPAVEAVLDGILDDLADMRPTTLPGIVAMARAALACLPRDQDGDAVVEDGADGMLVRVAEALAGPYADALRMRSAP